MGLKFFVLLALLLACSCATPKTRQPSELAVAGSRWHSAGSALAAVGSIFVVGGASASGISIGVGSNLVGDDTDTILLSVGLAQVTVGSLLLVGGLLAISSGDALIQEAHEIERRAMQKILDRVKVLERTLTSTSANSIEALTSKYSE